MLIGMSIGNYRSFNEVVTFSMAATNITSRNKTLDQQTVFEAAKLSLLTSAAIYGANASGKSNFISALRFIRDFVINSARSMQIDDPIKVERFRLSTATIDQPSFFELSFIIEPTQYRYGFEVTPQAVVSEWLYHSQNDAETLVFEREGEQIELAEPFKEFHQLRQFTRNNALFLSVIAQFNGEIAKTILKWFTQLQIDLSINDRQGRTNVLGQFEQSDDQAAIIHFVKALDVGIADIQVERIVEDLNPDDYPVSQTKPPTGSTIIVRHSRTTYSKLKTLHEQFDANGNLVGVEDFDIETHESDGTKKLLALAFPIVQALKHGYILVIDELDARIHPLITWEIIKLFNTAASNPHHAQLIFTTHDTNLLSHDLFRRDQIWFTEKTRHGATKLYSLVEYKVGNTGSLEKNYIEGRYGAIPFLGDIAGIMGAPDE
ncbi:AAA family ATPase [Herpetosiphon giganteus]|uniref:AAA family ATPase n=1 Tax=Herpetosiphon giganteus TaxID=2029754 RepID=UPI00195EE71A|nr:ATP-binding protein [Herpetosiphon giganteus]MBM7845669.1 AAA15 family ATPase/GTPase [Herpetosiphon giganteus]